MKIDLKIDKWLSGNVCELRFNKINEMKWNLSTDTRSGWPWGSFWNLVREGTQVRTWHCQGLCNEIKKRLSTSWKAGRFREEPSRAVGEWLERPHIKLRLIFARWRFFRLKYSIEDKRHFPTIVQAMRINEGSTTNSVLSLQTLLQSRGSRLKPLRPILMKKCYSIIVWRSTEQPDFQKIVSGNWNFRSTWYYQYQW